MNTGNPPASHLPKAQNRERWWDLQGNGAKRRHRGLRLQIARPGREEAGVWSSTSFTHWPPGEPGGGLCSND